MLTFILFILWKLYIVYAWKCWHVSSCRNVLNYKFHQYQFIFFSFFDCLWGYSWNNVIFEEKWLKIFWIFIKLINCDCILDIPTIENRSLQTVNESESVTLIRNIVSNPLSNASWYIGTQLLKTESSVQTTTLTIEQTKCTDTNNYTVVASNGVGNNVTRLVELIVNCKFDYKVYSLVSEFEEISKIS